MIATPKHATKHVDYFNMHRKTCVYHTYATLLKTVGVALFLYIGVNRERTGFDYANDLGKSNALRFRVLMFVQTGFVCPLFHTNKSRWTKVFIFNMPICICALGSNYVFILAAIAALNNCNLGYDMGIVSSVGPILLDQSAFPVSGVQLELFVGALDMSSLLGAAISNYIADKFGRKACMAFSEILFVISVVGMACAQNYATLVTFRCICGIAVGLGLTIGPLYIGELAPSSVRGKLVSWSEIATNVGLLVAFIVGAAFSGLPTSSSWRVMLGLGSLLPAVLLLSLWFMPESPRWLIMQGKNTQAEEVLLKLYPNSVVDPAILVHDIQVAISNEDATYINGGWHAILHPTHATYYALLAALGIAAIQQLSGIEALTSYFVFIFQRAGLKSAHTYLYLILFGVCKLVTVYIASRWFDNPHCGRRPLLLASGVGVFMCMFLFAWIFSSPTSAASGVACVITMFAYVIAYSVGYGPGTWVVMLEVLPLQIRAKGLSLCTFVNRLIATILSGTFLTLVRYMRYCGYFWLFAALTLGCVVYVYALIPETQGRTLEGMSAVFNKPTTTRVGIEDNECGMERTEWMDGMEERKEGEEWRENGYNEVAGARGSDSGVNGSAMVVITPLHSAAASVESDISGVQGGGAGSRSRNSSAVGGLNRGRCEEI